MLISEGDPVKISCKTMLRRAALPVMLAIFTVGCGSTPPAPPPAIDAGFIERTIAEYADAGAAFREAVRSIQSQQDVARAERLRPAPVPRATELIQWAREHSSDPLAAPILVTIAVYGRFGPEAQEAVKVLAQDQVDELKSPHFDDMFEEIVRWPAPTVQEWLRTFYEKSQVRRTRATAGLMLALYERSLAEQAGSPVNPEWSKMMKASFGEHAVDYLADLDRAALQAESTSILERVVAEYSDVDLGGGTVGAIAKPTLFEWTRLAIGQEIPELDGEDLAGEPLKLSDYRGQVVMLSFWASWCEPCMRLVPHEQELVRRYRGKPFALLGVNDDDNVEQARRIGERMRMTWRSWRKDPKAGPSILEQWNVQGIPMIYVIDKAGIIQGKRILGEELQTLLDRLVDE